jgi:peptide subunit release factor 1 (eRF1)
LIYADGIRSHGFECPSCSALFALEGHPCPICGAKLEATNDVVERAVENAFRKGAAIEVVKGEASETLKDAGGIGALLKVRTARA